MPSELPCTSALSRFGQAENDVGSGPYSAVGQFRTAATVPSQPDAPTCYAVGPVSVPSACWHLRSRASTHRLTCQLPLFSQNGAYLHWLPTPCNGSPITRHQIQMLEVVDGQETWVTVYSGLDCKCEILNLKVTSLRTCLRAEQHAHCPICCFPAGHHPRLAATLHKGRREGCPQGSAAE